MSPVFTPATIEDRTTWTHIAADPAAREAITQLTGKLDAIEPNMPTPSAADYLAAKRSNDRARTDSHWRKTRPNFTRLAVNRLVRGIEQDDADDRLLNWLFTYTYEPTWTVSAHLPEQDLPLSGTGQLDLAGCEAAGELAEAREVLLRWMSEQSKTLSESIVRELDRRILGPVMASEEPAWWAKLNAKRTDARRLNNWTGVCAGSILAACQSLEATGIARPDCRDRMIKLLNVFFDVAFGESGECEEGIGYWTYGIEYALLPMMRMSREQLADAFDLKRIELVVGYPERSHLVGNLFFAGNDSEPRTNLTPGAVSWLAELVDSDFLRWWYGIAPPSGLRGIGHALRFLQVGAALQPATRPTGGPTHEPNRLLADQQAAIFQRGGKDQLLTFTLTGGTNAELHNHNDLGTFQLIVGEKIIIPDLGQPRYVMDFFKSEARYTKYMVAASSGHCCPAINGVEQREGAEAAGKLLAWRPESGEMALDLTSAYPPAAKLKRWTRVAHVPNDETIAQLTDTFELVGEGVVTHRIWFVDEPKVNGATLEAGDGVTVTFEPKPETLEVLPFKAGDDRLMLRGYKADHTLYRVDCTYRASGKPLEVKTLFELR